jgi:eukaryotic-like serine/threonine-protein kinase
MGRTMNEERWEQLKRLCEEAREFAPKERAAWLAEACVGDEELRREVESLLGYSSRAEAFIEQPAFKLFAHELEQAPSLLGWQFGHYRIESLLGVGGMGEVYKAQDTKLGRAVAVKFLPGEFTSDTERVRRFEQEAYAASSLNHPYIVTVYEIGQVEAEHGARHYIAYELIEGQTLRHLLRQTKLVWPEAVRIAIQIAEALKAAHEARIIHRDIKPENVMLRPDGRVKVLDFGIAKRFNLPIADEMGNGGHNGAANAGSTTLTGGLLGTPRYLSPEQARLERVDEGTDIFALGLMLYEMLAGRHPFADKSSEEIVTELLNDRELPVLSDEVKAIPAALAVVVNKAVRKTRAERYSTIGQMLDALNEFKPALEGQAPGKLRGMQSLFKTQNANRLLNQFVSLYAVDEQARLSALALWTVWRHSDVKRGKLEAALLRRSLASMCWQTARVALLAGLLTLAVTAWFSIEYQWDERFMWDGHSQPAKQLALAPDERTLVSVGDDSKVIVWDLARRVRQATLTEHTQSVSAVTFAPGGKLFATAGSDSQVIVWDAARLTKVAVLPGSRGDVDAIAFTPNGRWFVGRGGKWSLEHTPIWEVGTWRNVGQLPGLAPLLLSPDSRLVVTGSWWAIELATGRDFTTCSEPGWSYAALSPDATRLATVDTGGWVAFWNVSQLWDAGRHRLIGRYPAHRDHGRAVAYSPDGRMVATGSEEIIVWDAATHAKLARFTYKDIVTSLVFTSDSRQLISAHGSGAVLVWDIAEKVLAADFAQHCGPVRAVSFSPDGRSVASASQDHSVILWDATSGLKRAVLLGHQAPLVAVAFSRDGQTLASSDMYGNAILWEAQTQTQLRSFASLRQADTALGYCATLSPDGRWLATTFGVYDTSNGRAAVKFAPPEEERASEIHGVAFSADGRWLACVATGGYVYLWEVARWRLRQSARTQGNQVAVGFAPDGHALATGSDSGTIRLWQVEPLRELAVIGQHKSGVQSVAFSPTGSELVSASDDETLALWDVARRRFIANVGRHNPSVLAATFSPDGRQIASGEYDKSVRIYTRRQTLWGWWLE